MLISRKVATELAREGLKLRTTLIRGCKPALLGIISEGDSLYVCTESEYYTALLPVALIDVKYDDTIKSIADKIYKLNR